jgi:hypothetical protein
VEDAIERGRAAGRAEGQAAVEEARARGEARVQAEWERVRAELASAQQSEIAAQVRGELQLEGRLEEALEASRGDAARARDLRAQLEAQEGLLRAEQQAAARIRDALASQSSVWGRVRGKIADATDAVLDAAREHGADMAALSGHLNAGTIAAVAAAGAAGSRGGSGGGGSEGGGGPLTLGEDEAAQALWRLLDDLQLDVGDAALLIDDIVDAALPAVTEADAALIALVPHYGHEAVGELQRPALLGEPRPSFTSARFSVAAGVDPLGDGADSLAAGAALDGSPRGRQHQQQPSSSSRLDSPLVRAGMPSMTGVTVEGDGVDAFASACVAQSGALGLYEAELARLLGSGSPALHTGEGHPLQDEGGGADAARLPQQQQQGLNRSARLRQRIAGRDAALSPPGSSSATVNLAAYGVFDAPSLPPSHPPSPRLDELAAAALPPHASAHDAAAALGLLGSYEASALRDPSALPAAPPAQGPLSPSGAQAAAATALVLEGSLYDPIRGLLEGQQQQEGEGQGEGEGGWFGGGSIDGASEDGGPAAYRRHQQRGALWGAEHGGRTAFGPSAGRRGPAPAAAVRRCPNSAGRVPALNGAGGGGGRGGATDTSSDAVARRILAFHAPEDSAAAAGGGGLAYSAATSPAAVASADAAVLSAATRLGGLLGSGPASPGFASRAAADRAADAGSGGHFGPTPVRGARGSTAGSGPQARRDAAAFAGVTRMAAASATSSPAGGSGSASSRGGGTASVVTSPAAAGSARRQGGGTPSYLSPTMTSSSKVLAREAAVAAAAAGPAGPNTGRTGPRSAARAVGR